MSNIKEDMLGKNSMEKIVYSIRKCFPKEAIFRLKLVR